MREPRWLSRRMIDTMHRELIAEHGGHRGARDDGLIGSALARPMNRWSYDPDTDLATLASGYGFGLARNHGYMDGNKRIALAAIHAFVWINGFELEVAEPEEVVTMIRVAEGSLSEGDLADWMRDHLRPR